jgi:hypothetical protein
MVVRDPGGRRRQPLQLDTRMDDGRDGVWIGETDGLVTRDEYFDSDRTAVLALLLDHLVETLPEPDRSCVVMVAMKGLPLSQAAELLSPSLGRTVHRKTVQRWTLRGLERLNVLLGETTWAHALLPGRIPAGVDVPALRADVESLVSGVSCDPQTDSGGDVDGDTEEPV